MASVRRNAKTLRIILTNKIFLNSPLNWTFIKLFLFIQYHKFTIYHTNKKVECKKQISLKCNKSIQNKDTPTCSWLELRPINDGTLPPITWDLLEWWHNEQTYLYDITILACNSALPYSLLYYTLPLNWHLINLHQIPSRLFFLLPRVSSN